MLPWLLQHVPAVAGGVESATAGDSPIYLTARIAAAATTAFLFALLFGPVAIRLLQSRCRERIDSASARLNELHAAKGNTPTMGGLFILAAITAAALLFGDLTNPLVLLALAVVLSFGLLGAADDWIKLNTQRRGLTVRQKFALQVLLATGTGVGLYLIQRHEPHGLELVWPFGGRGLFLGAAFIAWAAVVLVGSSNGVNLTDGLDGLAGGCLLFAGSAFVALCYLAGHASLASYLSIPHLPAAGELSVVMAAMVGAVLGFLWFNCHPAQVFMGDTGSLPLGALLGLAALATRQELLLVLVGGMFVIETLSVILQVGCYKLFGRRVIACSPLHNHFVFRGHSEIKIVIRFWIGSALLAILGVASLQIR